MIFLIILIIIELITAAYFKGRSDAFRQTSKWLDDLKEGKDVK